MPISLTNKNKQLNYIAGISLKNIQILPIPSARQSSPRSAPLQTLTSSAIYSPPNALPTAYFEKVNKANLSYVRLCINGFLNSTGGNVVFGVKNLIIKGIPLTVQEKDEIRLSTDGIMNNFVPQIDSELIDLQFIQVENVLNRIVKNGEVCENFVIQLTVPQSNQNIVFMSAGRTEAFYYNEKPVQLTADQIVNRYEYPRGECLKAEMQNKVIDEQQCMISAALEFVEKSMKPTRIIVIEGPSNSGKSFIAQSIYNQLRYEVQFKMYFSKYKYLNDIYREMIQQVNSSIKINFKVANQVIEEIGIPTSPANSIDDIIRGQLSPTPIRCSVLRNILFNETANHKCLYLFDAVNTYVDDIVNKGSQSTYIIVTEDAHKLMIECGPAVDILTLQTHDMSSKELTVILNNRKINILEVETEQLLKKFNYDVNKLTFYLQNGIEQREEDIQLTEEEEKHLLRLCLVPGRFSMQFIEYQLQPFNEQKLMLINRFLYKNYGYFQIPKGLRLKLLGKLSTEEIRNLSLQLIQYTQEQIKILNKKFNNQFHNKSKESNFDIKQKLIALEINEFIINNLRLIEEAIKRSVEFGILVEDLYKDLKVFVMTRVPITVMEDIKAMKSKLGIQSSE